MKSIKCGLTQIEDLQLGKVNVPAAGAMLSQLGFDWKADQAEEGKYIVSLCGKDEGKDIPKEVLDELNGEEN